MANINDNKRESYGESGGSVGERVIDLGGGGGGGGGQVTYDAIVAPTGGDYTSVVSAIAAGKKTIFVRKGTYTESTITLANANPNVVIIGQDRDGTILRFPTGSDGLQMYSNGALVENLTLDTRTNNGQAALVCSDGQPSGSPNTAYGNYNTVRNCRIQGPSVYGTFTVFFAGPSYSAGAATLAGFEANALSDGNRITDCIIEGNQAGDVLSFSMQKNGVCSNNTAIGGRIAFYMQRSSDCSDNNSQDSAGEGIFLAGPSYDNTVANNIIKGSAADGIKLQNQLEHVPLIAGQTIRGNVIKGNVITNAGNIGFSMSGTETGQIRNNIIANNFVDTPGFHGFYLQDASENVFLGNSVLNPNETNAARGSGFYLVVRNKKNVFAANVVKDDRAVTKMNYSFCNREDNTCTGNVLNGNQFNGKSTDRNVWIQSNNFSIAGNHIEGGAYTGLYLDGANFASVTSNTFENNTNDSNNSWSEIWCGNGATNNYIDGNTFNSTATNKAKSGIWFQSAADTANKVGKNVFNGMVTMSIDDSGTANDLSVHNLSGILYVGTTPVAMNRASGALTLAGLILTAPEIGSATGTSLTLGTASSLAGELVLNNATNAFTQTIRGSNPGASIAYVLPATAPTVGQVLSASAPSAGVVTMSWATVGGGFSWGATATGSSGVGIALSPTSGATGGQSISVANSSTAPTVAWDSLVLGNTQAVAHTMQTIDLGTSAQGHTGQLIKMYNASTSAVGLKIDLSSTGTGNALYINSTSASALRSIFVYRSGATTNATEGAVLQGYTNGATNGNYPYSTLNLLASGSAILPNSVSIQYQQHPANLGTFPIDSGTYLKAGVFVDVNNASDAAAMCYGWYSTSNLTKGIYGWHKATAERTFDVNRFLYNRSLTTGVTQTDTFNLTHVKRVSLSNHASAVLNAGGSVLKLENVSTQTLGTLTDTVACLSLVQSDSSTGGHILFNAYSGVPTVDGTMYFDGTNFKCRIGGVTKTFTIV